MIKISIFPHGYYSNLISQILILLASVTDKMNETGNELDTILKKKKVKEHLLHWKVQVYKMRKNSSAYHTM